MTLLINGLPFNIEKYERTKNILKDKFWQSYEIIDAHVKKIQQLLAICGTNAKNVYEFYETVAYKVQALDTKGTWKKLTK